MAKYSVGGGEGAGKGEEFQMSNWKCVCVCKYIYIFLGVLNIVKKMHTNNQKPYINLANIMYGQKKGIGFYGPLRTMFYFDIEMHFNLKDDHDIYIWHFINNVFLQIA